jgi:hypothetical protein
LEVESDVVVPGRFITCVRTVEVLAPKETDPLYFAVIE